MILQNIQLALAGIRQNKLRSILTILGMVIGIAAVVSISAIGEGVKKQVSNEITGLGSNVVTTTSGKAFSTDKNGKKTANFSASVGSSTLTQGDIDTIKDLNTIKTVAPIMLVSGVVDYQGNTSDGSYLVATTPSFNDIRGQKPAQGRWLQDGDNTQAVVVLGSQAKEDLFGAANALGESVTVRGTPFIVVGVMATTDNGTASLTGGGFDNIIYLPISEARAITGGNLQILRIMSQTKQSNQVDTAVDEIKQALLKNHGGQEDFSVLTQKDLIATVGSILNLLSTFIAAIASIALLVGGIGIMNIMLVTVTERTREIGIRKAIGATNRQILGQFLVEAIVLSLMGGIVGIGAAVGQAELAGKLAKVTPAFTLNSFLLAVGVSLGIGIIFGLAPAIKAARKNPIQALRYE